MDDPVVAPERRLTDVATGDTSRILAILYTVGFFGLVLSLMWREVPPANKEAILLLLGMLGVAQTGIIKFFFDGSKTGELGQRAVLVGKEKADTALQEIAKAAAPSAKPNGT